MTMVNLNDALGVLLIGSLFVVVFWRVFERGLTPRFEKGLTKQSEIMKTMFRTTLTDMIRIRPHI